MKPDDIKIGPRARTNLGDLDALANSIGKVGLIQPIVVDSNNVLICGHRRLEACRRLMLADVEVRVVDTAADTLTALQMENDENEQRKPFTPSEAVAMGRLIEDQIKAEAKQRQVANLNGSVAKNARCTPWSTTGGGKSADKIASAVGLSRCSMERAKKVVEQGAPALVEAMDNDEVSIRSAETLSDLTHDEQQAILAGGKPAIKQAVAAKRQSNSQAKPTKSTKSTKKTKRNPVISEDAMHEPDSPFSAKTIRVRVIHALDGLRLTDPNAESQLRLIEARIAELLAQLEKAK